MQGVGSYQVFARAQYGSCKFYEKEIAFGFCPGFVDVECDPCGSGPADQSSDFLFEQE